MTTNVDIVNRALVASGIPKKIVSLTQDSVEAQVANSFINIVRDDLLRMAPWNCSTAFIPLVYITSTPGTPENTSMGTPLWTRGQPPPPWAYMYQYPVDCLRPLYIVPQFQSGFTSGIPISGVVTGGAASFWQGPPVKFKVATEQFLPLTNASPNVGGTGYKVGDIVTLAVGPTTSPPIGAPAQLIVASIGGGGTVTSVTIVNQVQGSAAPVGGSYFFPLSNPVAQGSTTGVGTGLTIDTGTGPLASQRVILTNQEFALCCYIKQITDPNVMDNMFQHAWIQVLSSRLIMALIGDKQLANMRIQEANSYVVEARKADGNEGLTVNDTTPDWIRVRGISYSDYSYTPNVDFNWGQLWTPF